MLGRYKYYILTFCIGAIYIYAQSPYMHGDFKVYLAAAKYFTEGKNPYGDWLLWNNQVTDRFFYGPAFGLALIPLLKIPEVWAFCVFGLVQVLFAMRSYYLLQKMLRIDGLSTKQQWFWILLTILCSIRFILHNIEGGQVTISIFYFTLEGLYQIFYGRKVLGSILLGIAIHIKIMPLIFIPYLLWRKEWLATTISLITFVILCFTPLLLFDMPSTLHMLSEWWNGINPIGNRYITQQEQLSFQMQGLQALLAAYLLDSDFPFSSSKNKYYSVKPPAVSSCIDDCALNVNIFYTLLFASHFV